VLPKILPAPPAKVLNRKLITMKVFRRETFPSCWRLVLSDIDGTLGWVDRIREGVAGLVVIGR
jgi:hypothetical protein